MSQAPHRTDVAVIGAGPVGLFTVFECGMLKLQTHVVDALDAAGGQCAALYPEKPIYDIPAFPSIEAAALIDRLEAQAAPFKPVYHFGQRVDKLERTAENRWLVTTSAGTQIDAAAVILAAGAGAFGPNRPPLEGLERFEGTSVHYMVRRRQDFAGKRVVIAGGGDSAVDWAISLAEIAASVQVVHRRAKFRAAPESVAQLDRLAKEGKIELVTPYQLSGLEGDGAQLAAVKVADLDDKERSLPADALLAFFGLSMNLGPINDWGLELERSHVKATPPTMATNLPGVFAVGDVATYPGKLKLILCGFAEAAQAAHAARAVVHPGEELHFEYSTSKGAPGADA